MNFCNMTSRTDLREFCFCINKIQWSMIAEKSYHLHELQRPNKVSMFSNKPPKDLKKIKYLKKCSLMHIKIQLQQGNLGFKAIYI